MSKKVAKEDASFAHVLTKSNAEIDAEHERRQAADPFYGRVKMGRDEQDKRIDADDLDEFSVDPLREAVSAARSLEKPGDDPKSYKLLSDRCCSHLGTRGYEPVLDESGDRIQVGNMFLGSIPQQLAERRKKRFQEESASRIRNMQQSQAERISALRREAKDLGLKVLEAGDSVENVGDGETYDMGITVERGSGNARRPAA